MTPRAIASRLLENDEDFSVSGEITRLSTSLHPDYEIESEGAHWNVYKKIPGKVRTAFIGEITYDDMANMPRETMTPEQIAMWDTHRWMASAGFRDNERAFCKSFAEAFQFILTTHIAKTSPPLTKKLDRTELDALYSDVCLELFDTRHTGELSDEEYHILAAEVTRRQRQLQRPTPDVSESEDADNPDLYVHPDRFTKQPSEEKIESALRVKLRPYYPEVRISKRTGMFSGRIGASVKITDNYVWTIHCNRDTQLPLPKNTSAYHGQQFVTGVDWRSQVRQWFHDWAHESGLHIRGFEIHGRLRKDPTFQFETTRIGPLKENEDDDLTPEQFLAHHVDKQEIKQELLDALWKWHPAGTSYNALVGNRHAIVMVTLYFPPEKNDFYLKFVEFVKNWITNRKLFPVTITKLTGGPHYPHDSNYPRWGLTLAVNMDWPSDTPAYTPAETSPAVVPTGQEP